MGPDGRWRKPQESAMPVPGDEIGEQLQAGALTLFRMKLCREDISPGNRASKRKRIMGDPGRHAVIVGLGVITVGEIKTRRFGDAPPQRMWLPLPHGTPPHVRNLEALSVGECHRVL